ncbi:hypothetical protein TPA0905_49920 [Streptomyces olivaceus]|nr:hypothetical protein TPA0905_49920 [Streptomyces olivaceus]
MTDGRAKAHSITVIAAVRPTTMAASRMTGFRPPGGGAAEAPPSGSEAAEVVRFVDMATVPGEREKEAGRTCLTINSSCAEFIM